MFKTPSAIPQDLLVIHELVSPPPQQARAASIASSSNDSSRASSDDEEGSEDEIEVSLVVAEHPSTSDEAL